ncbi:MAG: cobalamin-binding protein [Planctomycetota bacterium]
MRIVSLLPSATEIVCSLGLREQLVGVTHECDFPDGVQSLPSVTRTLIPHDATSGEIDTLVRERLKTEKALYSLDMETLKRLEPDLIVTQALCDVCAVAEHEVNAAACSLPSSPRVINLEPTCLQEVFDCIAAVGAAVGLDDKAREVIAGLQARVGAVARRASDIFHRPRVMLLEWIEPPFSAGHWSPELVEIAGGREVIGKAGERSTMVPWENITRADPELLVVACCGFTPERAREDLPILESKPGWASLSCVRDRQVHFVDGSAYFSRPGPRLVDSLEILAELVAGCQTKATPR